MKRNFIPYGKQFVDKADIMAVVEVLRGDWLTTGPMVETFEREISEYVGVKHAIAVSSGTAALHTAMFAAGIEPGDEVIVPPITFAATANAVVYMGGIPLFADVQPDTLLIDPELVESKITPHTRAIIAVDYAGHPADYDELRRIADEYGLLLISDACHSLGAEYKGKKCGCLADITVFSFHPVKHITAGEGGMAVTNDDKLAERARRFRNHGIDSDFHKRASQGSWYYEMVDLGYNYRLTDIQCALGRSQLHKLDSFIANRRMIAKIYNREFLELEGISPLNVKSSVRHAYHLYVIQLNLDELDADRGQIFTELREAGIGVNVHYIPVHLHPYYRNRFRTGYGLCPAAEAAYERIISLPIFPSLTLKDIEFVIEQMRKVVRKHSAVFAL